jgi:hypothetical protein
MPLTTKDGFLKAASRGEPVRLKLRSCGEEVFLLDPAADVRDEFDMWARTRQDNLSGVRGVVASLLLCDEKGERMFSVDDAPALGEMRADILSEIFDRGTRLLGMTDKEVEELAEK